MSLTKAFRQLERALKIYIGTVLGIRVQGDSWDGLCEKINHTEDRYSNRKEGFWHSIWYKMGDYSSMLDGWVALIPDAYGLAVVKTGLAVVFKVSLTCFMYILLRVVQGLGLTMLACRTLSRETQENIRHVRGIARCPHASGSNTNELSSQQGSRILRGTSLSNRCGFYRGYDTIDLAGEIHM